LCRPTSINPRSTAKYDREVHHRTAN